MSKSPEHSENLSLGIAFTLAFCVLAPLTDGLAKYLGDSFTVFALIAFRFFTQALVLFPLAGALGEPLRIPKGLHLLLWARVILHIAGIALIFTALKFLPLADALAIAYVVPFIAMGLGALFLGETVGPVRIGFAILGFIGTLLVIQPNFANVGWPALLPLLVAFVFAVFMIVTRKVARAMPAVALQGINGVMGSGILLILWALGAVTGSEVLSITWTGSPNWAVVAVFGLTGAAAHLAMSWALRHAPAATVAPIQYLEIPSAALIGLLLFSDFPNGLALLGIVISITAGLSLIFWEQAKAARRASPQ